MSNTNRPVLKYFHCEIGLQPSPPVQVLISWMLRWNRGRPVLNFHPSRDGWFIYADRFFPLLHTLFLWVHPCRPYSSGTIGLESPSKGFYFTWRSLPECCHPLGDICLPVCFEEEQGSISKSEWATGWKINDVLLTGIPISDEDGDSS